MAKTGPKPIEFTTPDREREPIPFKLDGVAYDFAPAKIAATVLPMMDAEAAGANGDYRVRMSQATWDWLKEGLPADQYARIIARLQDPKDSLDYPDVAALANDLVRVVAARPTRRR